MTEQFFLVWNMTSKTVYSRHATLESAEAEARRLARHDAGKEFVVFASVSSSKCVDVVTEKHELITNEITEQALDWAKQLVRLRVKISPDIMK